MTTLSYKHLIDLTDFFKIEIDSNHKTQKQGAGLIVNLTRGGTGSMHLEMPLKYLASVAVVSCRSVCG